MHIRAAHAASRRTYGAPRIHQELRAHGIPAGRHRIARLMRREGIVACTERHFRWTATARAELPAAPNRLRRDFRPRRPISAGSPTSPRCAPARAGSSRHRARSLLPPHRRLGDGARSDQELVHEALTMALAERRPAPGLLFHSDRGGQYLSRESSNSPSARASSPAPVGPAAASTTPSPRASSTRSRPSWSTSTAIAPATRRASRSSTTSPRSTTEPGGTRALRIAHPTSTKRSTPSAAPNPVSTFLGQVQSAAAGCQASQRKRRVVRASA